MKKLLCACLLFTSLIALGQNTYKTEFATINGKKVAYRSSGVLTRNPGKPIIVFENGATSPKTDWEVVVSYLPKNIAWITYDRSGLYESEIDTTIQNDIDVVNRSHQLLQAIKATPPYVLVGHSYGGPLVRLYTAMYPAEVEGIVFYGNGFCGSKRTSRYSC